MAWWMVNGRRTKGMQMIPIEEFDPVVMMDAFRKEGATRRENEPTVREMSDQRKKELIKKMDAAHYKEYHSKMNKK
jgi:hypothetical protein